MILTPSFNTTVSAVKTILDNGGGGDVQENENVAMVPLLYQAV